MPHYEEAIRIAPAYIEARYNLAFALSSLGRAAEAISAFQKAADLAPASAAAELDWSRCLQALSQPEAAEVHRQNAARLQAGGGR